MLDPRPGTFRSALRSRALRVTLLGWGCSAAGLGALSVVVSIELYARTGSPAWASVGAVVRVAPFVLLSPVGGVLGDRYDPGRVLWASFAGIAASALLLVALVSSSAPVALLALGSLLAHVAATPAYPAVAAMVPRVVGSSDLAPGMSLVSTLESVAWFVGPGLGGVLVTTLGAPAAVTAALVLAVVGLMVTLLLRRTGTGVSLPKTIAGIEGQSFRRLLRDGVAAIVSTRAVLGPLLLLATVELVFGASQVVLLVAATDLFGMSEGGFGAIVAAMGLGALVSVVVVNRLAGSDRPLLVLAGCIVITGGPVALVSVVVAPPAAVPLLALSGAGVVLCEVLLLTTMQRNVPLDRLSRVFGVLDSVAVTSILVGSVLAAPLVTVFGVRGALVVLGVAVPAVAILSIPLLVEGRDPDAVPLEHIRHIVELLGGVRVLTLASRTAVESMAAAAVRRQFTPGTVVVRSGDPADAFYVIEAGVLDVLAAPVDGGDEVWVRQLQPGDGFGEIGLMHQVPRSATVVARTEVVLYEVPGEAFARALGPGRVTGGGVGMAATVRDLWAVG